VLSDIPTLRELWDGAAIFVDAEDPQAYAEVFNRLLGDTDARRRLAAQAQARSGRYSVAGMTAGVLDLYGRLQPRLAGAVAQEVAA
jgi:glycosyltransferase involved in cell wall biosynthesis